MKITQLRKPVVAMSGEGEELHVLGTTLVRKAGEIDTGNTWACFEEIAPVDTASPLHAHPWDEAYYILEGEVEILVDENIVMAAPGCFVNIPGGTPHQFTVRSFPYARFLVWFSPAQSAESFYGALAREMGAFPPADMNRVMEIAQKYNVQVYTIE
ncbi:MAG: cupin domain-containing protein [Scytolyngbya sp. HA4215-MV1]|jgi:mannose-6-phosphate isomerase-like protein (cupin superfamily)|nr:cupin domain-containing protein [Scytolyngbya sp. HA4215-MV1]